MRELESRTDWFHAAPASGSVVLASATLKGLRVSGHREVTGRVRVLRHADDLMHLRPCEIAVFGVAQAMQQLQTGDVVTLGGDGCVRVLEHAKLVSASSTP